jgi:peroxiredoxin
MESKRDAAAKWKKDFKAPFPILFDPRMTISNRYQVEVLPLNVAIDKTGKVVKVIEGVDAAALDAAAKKIVAKK